MDCCLEGLRRQVLGHLVAPHGEGSLVGEIVVVEGGHGGIMLEVETWITAGACDGFTGEGKQWGIVVGVLVGIGLLGCIHLPDQHGWRLPAASGSSEGNLLVSFIIRLPLDSWSPSG